MAAGRPLRPLRDASRSESLPNATDSARARLDPVDDRASSPGGRLAIALELADLAVAMVEQKLRRTHPDATPQEIAQRVRQWQRTRPGAEHGDAWGRPIPWPRQS